MMPSRVVGNIYYRVALPHCYTVLNGCFLVAQNMGPFHNTVEFGSMYHETIVSKGKELVY